MGKVVGMDGEELPQAKLTAEQQLKQWEVEERARKERQRLQMLTMAMELQNPSTYNADTMVQVAKKFEKFVTEESKDDAQDTQSVPPVAP